MVIEMEEIINSHDVVINDSNTYLRGKIYLKDYNKGWVIFSHGTGAFHWNAGNLNVAKELTKAGYATLVFDLLTKEESDIFENSFNISLLSHRLLIATKWLMNSKYYNHGTPIGYFGVNTGTAAALMAMMEFSQSNLIYSLISCEGRTDLVDEKILSSIFTPTLLIVGGQDIEVIELNKVATQSLLNCRLSLIPRTIHLLERPSTIDEVIRLSVEWLDSHVPNAANHLY
jgi:putative phosphoribosyl transferase